MLRSEDKATLFDITTRSQWSDLIKSMKISILISFKTLFKLAIYSLERCHKSRDVLITHRDNNLLT